VKQWLAKEGRGQEGPERQSSGRSNKVETGIISVGAELQRRRQGTRWRIRGSPASLAPAVDESGQVRRG